MKEEWIDTELALVIAADEPASSVARDQYSVVIGPLRNDIWLACDAAEKYASANPRRRVVVLVWTLGTGIVQVEEYQRGKLEPLFSHFSRESCRYFAPIIMPAIAAYLDAEARSMVDDPAATVYDTPAVGGACNCGADRTGPSAEAHSDACPAR